MALGGAQRITEFPTSLLPPRARAGFSAAVSSAALGGLVEGGLEGDGPRPEASPPYCTLRKMWRKHRKGGLERYAGAQVWTEIPRVVGESTQTLSKPGFPPKMDG